MAVSIENYRVKGVWERRGEGVMGQRRVDLGWGVLEEGCLFCLWFWCYLCMIQYIGRYNSWSKMMWVHCVEKFRTEVRFRLKSWVSCCTCILKGDITFYLACEMQILHLIVNKLELCVEDVKRYRLNHVHPSRILRLTRI